MTIFKKTALMFILLGLSISSQALVLDSATLDPTGVNGSLTGGYNITGLTGSFSQDITFDVVNASAQGVLGAVSVVSLNIGGIIGATNLTASINGTPITINTISPLVDLGSLGTLFTNGSYILTLTGDALPSGASLSGNVALNSVPVPAAVWLFASAIVGLFGFRQRKG